MDFKKIVLVLAATTVGLSAGLLFSYQVSVVPGFKTLTDSIYISAMQSVIVSIQNPIFFFAYMGAMVFLLLTTYWHRGKPASHRFKLLLASTLLYAATLIITIAVNVPLNNKLQAFPLASATPQQAHKARVDFEAPWNNWHLLRTLTATGSLVLVVLACITTAETASSRSREK